MEEKPQKFKAGQVVMVKAKKDIPFKILSAHFDEGEWFYQWNRNNFAAEHMIRALTPEERGTSSEA